MKSQHKKEHLIVVLIVIFAAAILYWQSHQPMPISIKNTASPIILSDEDFCITVDSRDIKVGTSTYDETITVYPRGKNLGLSTLYRPEGHLLLFEFTEKSNVLTNIHIEEPGIKTFRGVEVGNSMDQVVAAYGDGYTSVSTGQAGSLDMVYGEGNKIVLRINNNVVARIVIQHDPVTH